MNKVVFTEFALDHYSDWARENLRIFDKITALLKDTRRNPFKGIGKPEPLKHHLKGRWPRRIDEKNRLIYQVFPGEIHVLSCRGHYD